MLADSRTLRVSVGRGEARFYRKSRAHGSTRRGFRNRRGADESTSTLVEHHGCHICCCAYKKYEVCAFPSFCFIRSSFSLYKISLPLRSNFSPSTQKYLRTRVERDKREKKNTQYSLLRLRVVAREREKSFDAKKENARENYGRGRCEFEARVRASKRRVGQACVFYSYFVFFFSPPRFLEPKKKKLNKKRVFVFLLLLLLPSDLQGLNEKRRELSDKIRQDALAMERLEKRVEENKKKKKQVENLIEQGVQAKRKILETSKHILMHLKRESEAFFRESGAHGEQEDSY